ncbi:hypothetical protein TRFO_10051 [Tritrichomonas foetus]|uniref:Importin N-terminal domain-containing protein n=1 Tax=Tritrichomonas foetus TaxID=1144522 RepID=A0A1J4JFE7_9EUKA|nr:hypothetical protein TRFO_10051 [Tritrichomonas foetus]|eukprot:OHS96371.1 hypothetical protein TRFO_10051 [Tritrichomonas foetus]
MISDEQINQLDSLIQEYYKSGYCPNQETLINTWMKNPTYFSACVEILENPNSSTNLTHFVLTSLKSLISIICSKWGPNEFYSFIEKVLKVLFEQIHRFNNNFLLSTFCSMFSYSFFLGFRVIPDFKIQENFIQAFLNSSFQIHHYAIIQIFTSIIETMKNNKIYYQNRISDFKDNLLLYFFKVGIQFLTDYDFKNAEIKPINNQNIINDASENIDDFSKKAQIDNKENFLQLMNATVFDLLRFCLTFECDSDQDNSMICLSENWNDLLKILIFRIPEIFDTCLGLEGDFHKKAYEFIFCITSLRIPKDIFLDFSNSLVYNMNHLFTLNPIENDLDFIEEITNLILKIQLATSLNYSFPIYKDFIKNIYNFTLQLLNPNLLENGFSALFPLVKFWELYSSNYPKKVKKVHTISQHLLNVLYELSMKPNILSKLDFLEISQLSLFIYTLGKNKEMEIIENIKQKEELDKEKEKLDQIVKKKNLYKQKLLESNIEILEDENNNRNFPDIENEHFDQRLHNSQENDDLNSNNYEKTEENVDTYYSKINEILQTKLNIFLEFPNNLQNEQQLAMSALIVSSPIVRKFDYFNHYSYISIVYILRLFEFTKELTKTASHELIELIILFIIKQIERNPIYFDKALRCLDDKIYCTPIKRGEQLHSYLLGRVLHIAKFYPSDSPIIDQVFSNILCFFSLKLNDESITFMEEEFLENFLYVKKMQLRPNRKANFFQPKTWKMINHINFHKFVGSMINTLSTKTDVYYSTLESHFLPYLKDIKERLEKSTSINQVIPLLLDLIGLFRGSEGPYSYNLFFNLYFDCIIKVKQLSIIPNNDEAKNENIQINPNFVFYYVKLFSEITNNTNNRISFHEHSSNGLKLFIESASFLIFIFEYIPRNIDAVSSLLKYIFRVLTNLLSNDYSCIGALLVYNDETLYKLLHHYLSFIHDTNIQNLSCFPKLFYESARFTYFLLKLFFNQVIQTDITYILTILIAFSFINESHNDLTILVSLDVIDIISKYCILHINDDVGKGLILGISNYLSIYVGNCLTIFLKRPKLLHENVLNIFLNIFQLGVISPDSFEDEFRIIYDLTANENIHKIIHCILNKSCA